VRVKDTKKTNPAGNAGTRARKSCCEGEKKADWNILGNAKKEELTIADFIKL
jgi:hypothetical protein